MSGNSTLISNMSYTSKDFNNIYPELLDLVKKITYKWDPSISNESDPGVILLKLNAIIADKVNYNIDKNVLECFPLSVTQEANARQLYEQLGYFMKWYLSATTTVSLTWKDFDNYTKDANSYIELPRFTMVSDYENNVVYTLLSSIYDKLNTASNIKVTLDGTPTVVNAIQGVNVTYDINGETTIQASDLDQNNRLYFNDTNIAENGIFITNVDQENYSSWEKKDNLVTENLGNTYYSFGVLPGSNTCYIEFPEDAENIFRNGINVVYIKTLGQDGNINVGYLEKFYTDLSVKLTQGAEASTVSLTTDNIAISNVLRGLGGEDKESLQDAYRNYRHTLGTFNTLITLRDYINAILTTPSCASNAFVTDRTNDIQCSYKIVSSVNNVDTLFTEVDNHDTSISSLNAYNIKLYVLKYVLATIDNSKDFNSTFELCNENELARVKDLIQDKKSIPHDYSSIRTPEQWGAFNLLTNKPVDWDNDCTKYFYLENNTFLRVPEGTAFEPDKYFSDDRYFRSHYCLFKNIYPIDCRITPTRSLSEEEQKNLFDKINAYLFSELNSKKVDFGQAITPNQLEELIVESASEVSSASIQKVDMETYVSYWNGLEFKTVSLNDTSKYFFSYNNSKYKNVKVLDDFQNIIGNKYWGVYIFRFIEGAGGNNSTWVMSKIEDSNGQTAYESVTISDYVDMSTMPSSTQWKMNDSFRIEISPIERIRDEIYVKSILQGITPLFSKDTEFSFDINQLADGPVRTNIESLEFNTDIDITSVNNSYLLRDNESLKLYTSNLIDGDKYQDYVKYYYVSADVDSDVVSGGNRKLSSGEYLFVFWKETNYAYDPYQYKIFAQGNIIHPEGFTLTADSASVPSELQQIANNLYTEGSGDNQRQVGSSDRYRQLQNAENAYVEGIRNWLSGSKTITTRYVNSIVIPDTYNCYWVLNNKKTSEDSDKEYYVLFDDYTDVATFVSNTSYLVGDRVNYLDKYYECIVDGSTTGSFVVNEWRELPAKEYILNSGEYFFYQSSVGEGLNILGAGTRIVRNSTRLWQVEVINLENINEFDSVALEDNWFTMTSDEYITITEQQFFSIGSGATVTFNYKSGLSTSYNINSNICTELADIESITYSFDGINTSVLPSMGNIDNWRATSVLTLNLGNGQEGSLYEGQSIKINYVVPNYDNSYYEIITADPGTTKTIQSKFEVHSEYSSGVIYTSKDEDEDGNKEYNKLYAYEKVTSSDPSVVYDEADGGAAVIFSPSATLDPESISITFNVPDIEDASQGYLLAVYNPNSDLTGATLRVEFTNNSSSSILYPLGKDLGYNINEEGTYYYELPVEGTSTLTLVLSNLLRSKPKTIVINKLFKYSTSLEADEFDRYVELIPKFDEERKFNYTYSPSKNNMIEDPLDSESFLNPYHIYNKYTICQLDTSKIKYTVSTR